MALDHQTMLAQLEKLLGDVNPDSKKGRRRLEIIEAAASRFAEQGYQATSMDDVAADVGVAKGTLYLYFPKKIDLLVACMAREKLQWLPELMEIVEPGRLPAVKRLKRWVTVVITLPSRSPLLSKNLEELPHIVSELPAELLQQGRVNIVEFVSGVLDEIAGDHRWSEVEVRDRAHVLQSLANLGPIVRNQWVRPDMSAERYAAVLADLIVDGLRPRKELSK